uniref:Uncharacterized protein n=1 Tax=Candidatus Kentrum sp. SD TaxID=2126332 RepID=A0A450YRP7_9GAMM|nr:MAG: hypothetical protein BECKSD772F_GA0070984_102326 [Candidatus Kentron sp. SD]VFK44218.1 MAG: hypothetical protein BECKSD772E_GA0070983_10353 [Candidatus Kentron sp. SD]
MDLEIGRSSYYPEDSIYIRVGDNSIIMGRATAKRFVEAVMDVDHYHIGYSTSTRYASFLHAFRGKTG